MELEPAVSDIRWRTEERLRETSPPLLPSTEDGAMGGFDEKDEVETELTGESREGVDADVDKDDVNALVVDIDIDAFCD